jgi:glycosyltransferase involved in cell wall biosynthesis
MENKYCFTIIMPVYNEAKSILQDIEKINKLPGNYEVIVVDDGSTDGTSELIEKTEVKVISHINNIGYGAAIKTGIKQAAYDTIVITDADGSYPNERIIEMVQLFKDENYDMVVGARVGKNVKIPLIRKPAKWILNRLANYLSGTKIPDLNSGLRVMKKDVVERFMNILPNGFSFTTTITLAMLTNGYFVKYIPIDYLKREGKSKIKPIRDTLNFVQLIIRTVLYFNPLRVFVPLSISLVLFAFTVLILSWLLTGKIMDVSYGVILMTAVMVMTIGLLADLIDKRIQ